LTMENEEYLEQETVLLDHLLALLKWRWLIFLGTGLAGVAGIVFASLQIPVYTATTYFVPRGALGESAELSDLTGGNTGKDWRSVRAGNEIAQYYSLTLKAQPLVELVVRKEFETAEFGRVPLIETLISDEENETVPLANAISRFRGLLEVETGGGKIIKVSYTSREPQLSADVVNVLLQEYEELMNREERTSKTVAFVEKSRAEIQTALTQKELEISSAKLKRMDAGRGDAEMRLAALTREARYLEDQLATLNSEYAKAQIRDLQRKELSMSEIDIIDRPAPPMRKSNTSRTRIVLLFAFLGAAATMGFAIGVEYLARLRRMQAQHDFWTLLGRARRDLAIMCAAVLLAFGGAAAYYFGLIGK